MPDPKKQISITEKEPSVSSTLMAVALAAIKPLVELTVTAGAKVIGTKLKRLKAEKTQHALRQRAMDISQVKTLLSLERPQLITDFYSPQFLEMPDEKRIETGSEELEAYPRLIVSGVAGQGKTILFRYLALTELAKKRLPLFVELRNYKDTPNLTRLLSHELESLGFSDDKEVHEYLLDQASTVVFLDAFDEVPANHQQRVRKQIEDFSRKHPNVRVLVSSRPTLEIQASSFFLVTKLSPLSSEEAVLALRKMCRDTDNPDAIEAALKGRMNWEVMRLLTTPLMVALLLLHYRISKEFPKTTQSFYGDLFEVLFKRHDQTKGYTRVRSSNASENELRDLFGYVSYVTRKESAIEVDRPKLVDICEAGRKFHGRSFDPGGALDDIIHGTNLVLEEGAVCRFAHKSIQEFYGARFFIAQPEQDVARFLGARIRGWGQWRQFLEFVELLNKYLFCKHFVIPHVGWIAFNDEKKRVPNDWVPSKEAILRIFGADVLQTRGGRVVVYRPVSESVYYALHHGDSHVAPRLLDGPLAAGIEWKSIPPDPSKPKVMFQPPGEVNSPRACYTVGHLLSLPLPGNLIRRRLEATIKETLPFVLSCYEFVDHRSAQTDLFA